MKYIISISTIIILFAACNRDEEPVINNLADLVEANSDLVIDELIACAGGIPTGLFGGADEPTDVFFYPIEGAYDFRYFESENVIDKTDTASYIVKELDDEPVFNGYLRKFNNTPFVGERYGIVTFKTPGTLHICNAIKLKTNNKPTEVNADLLDIESNGVNPTFHWVDGVYDENAIYFQVISDIDGNLISGTYTFEQNFTFYDLENVVLNITDPTTTPALSPNQDYQFTLMGVSLDNWVNLVIQETFTTE